MSHEITLRDGHEHAVYGRGQAAWHKYGTVLPDLMTAQEVADHVKFPEIGTTPTFIRKTVTLPDGTETETYEEATGHYLTTATWHDGEVTPLGAVTQRWKPIQAAAAFQIFDPITSEMGAVYDAAGVLKGGKVFWVLARIPGKFTLDSNGVADESDRFLLFETANDGTGSATVRVTYIRVVCDNTLNVALYSGGENKPLKIRHTGDVAAKIAQTRGIVASAWETMKVTEGQFTLMAATKLTREQRSKFVTDALGIDLDKPLTTRSKNILREVSEILAIGRGTSKFPEQRETVWGVFNALTEYVDHSRTVRNAGSDGRLASVGFGSGDKLKTRAYESAVEMMADGSLVEVDREMEVDETAAAARIAGGASDFSALLDAPANV